MDQKDFDAILSTARCLNYLERLRFELEIIPSYTTAPRGTVIPQSDPPIEGGLVHSIKSLFQIFAGNLANTRPTDSQLAQIPQLVASIRELFRVYLMYQFFKVNDPRLKYCDIPSLGDTSSFLFVAGQCLQGEHIRRLIALDPELFRSTLFDSTGEIPAEIPEFWDRYNTGHEPNRRPPVDDRSRLGHECHQKALYGMSLQTLWFLGPLWLHLSEEVEMFPELADLALKAFVEHTSSLRSTLFHGPVPHYILVVSHVIWSDAWLKRFIAAGGAPALLGGTLMLLCYGEEVANTAFEVLQRAYLLSPEQPNLEAAENVMDIIRYQLDRNLVPECNSDVECALCLTLFHIFKQFGPGIIARKAAGAWFNPRLGHLSKRLSKDPQKYQTRREFDRLWQRCPQREVDHFDVIIRRYSILLFDPAQIYDASYSLDLGCINPACPLFQRLLSCRRTGTGFSNCDPEDQQFLLKWGHNLKLCGSCTGAVYCSRECQKVDWPVHRKKCKFRRSRKRRSH